MYGKALKPVPFPIPMLFITAPAVSSIVQDLQLRGWSPYASGTYDDITAEVQIMPDHLIVIVDGEVVLEDRTGDPRAPVGWWEAVSGLRDRILVVIVPHTFPLDDPNAAESAPSLIDNPGTATALVRVVHQ